MPVNPAFKVIGCADCSADNHLHVQLAKIDGTSKVVAELIIEKGVRVVISAAGAQMSELK